LAEFKIHPDTGTYYGMRFESTAHAWTQFQVPAGITVNPTLEGASNFVVTSMDIAMLRPSTATPDVRARIWSSTGTHLYTSSQSSTISSGTITPTESHFTNCSFGSGVTITRGTTYRFGAWANGDIRYGRRFSSSQVVRRELSNSLTSTSNAGTGDAVTVGSSTTASVIRVNYIHAPSAPTSVQANSKTFSSITVGWGTPSSNGDSAITGYQVRIGTSTGSFGAWVQKSSADRSHQFTNLNSSTTYVFQVAAQNSATTTMGTASAVGESSTTTDAPPAPSTPTLTVTRSGLVYTLSGSSTISSGSVSSFQIDRRESTDGGVNFGNWTNFSNPTGSSYSITFNSVIQRSYQFRVRAISNLNVFSAYNTSGTFHTPNVPLIPVNPIVLTKNVRKVTVDWDPFRTNANTIANYNGAVISGYQLEERYSSDGGVTWTAYSNITSTNASTTVFTTNDLLIAKTYQFRVRANSDVGLSAYQESPTIFISAYGQRRTASGFVPTENAKRFNGTSWVTISMVKRFNGTTWVDIQN
jgi:hypothetical protein